MLGQLASQVWERPAGGASSHKTLALIAVAWLVLPAVAAASAPKLKVSTAKRVTTQLALTSGNSLDGTTTGDGSKFDAREWSVGPCSRKAQRRVVCRFHLYGVLTDPEANEAPFDCLSYVSVKYAGKRSRRLGLRAYGTQCRDDAGGSEKRRPLPPGS